MKIIKLSLLVALTGLTLSTAQANDVTIPEKVSGYTIADQISVSGELRPRYEYVDDNEEKKANAFTNRFLLTADWKLNPNIDVVSSFLNVSSIGDSFSTSKHPRIGYPVVEDEEQTALQELYVRYNLKEIDTIVSVGKQKLSFNNDRHLAATDWRQTYKVYNSLYLKNNTIENLDFELAYVTKIHDNKPDTAYNNDVLALNGTINFYGSQPEKLKLSLYSFTIEDIHTTYGASIEGNEKLKDIAVNYRGEYSFINDSLIGNGTVSGVPSYYSLGINGQVQNINIGIGYDVQENGYTTPLGDLHSFNGKTDLAILESDVTTLRASVSYDTYKYGKISGEAYRFKQDSTGDYIGNEIDVSYSYDFAKNLNGSVSIAHLSNEDISSVENTTKGWIQVDYTF